MIGDWKLPKVKIFPDVEFLALAAADHFIAAAADAIQSHGMFSVALSGGSTPQSLYRILASEPFSEKLDWSRIHLFWGDERCVPPDHPDSNYFRAQKTLLANIPVPEENIHRIKAELPPKEAAQSYEGILRQFFSPEPGQNSNTSFDLTLLGMGDDGHTASIFPGTRAVHEEENWVSALYVDQVGGWRITLTPVILNQSRQALFLVAGSAKNWTLQKVLYGTYQPDRYPAQLIKPSGEEPLWLVDEAAASFL
jgi:6-phosphogluconolactonase